MIVDDNEDAADSLATLLSVLGHVVKVALDGPGALTALADFAPEIAFLDIGLPVLDGYELARRIRAQPGRGGVQLVAVTGYGQTSDRAHAKAAGFDVHLVKPVDLAVIEQVIAGDKSKNL